MTGASFAAGTCACGDVQFSLCSAPMFTHCCHCRDCQRQTGSAFVINGLIETDRIRLAQGDPPRSPCRPRADARTTYIDAASAGRRYGATTDTGPAYASCASACSSRRRAWHPTSTSSPARNCRGSRCRPGNPRSRSITRSKNFGLTRAAATACRAAPRVLTSAERGQRRPPSPRYPPPRRRNGGLADPARPPRN